MNKMNRKYIFLIAVLLPLLFSGYGCALHAQQDPQYSQYMFNQLALNPAFAGSREKMSSTLLYRNQWTGIEGAPQTAAFSYQMPLQKKKIGVGGEIISDHLGPRSTTALLLSYAYRISFLKGKLSFGLRMGAYNYAINWAKIDYKDKSDLYNIGIRDSRFTGTGDFGTYYYTRSFYWGIGFNHLNQGKIISADLSSLNSGGNVSRQAVHFFMPIGKAYQVGNVILNPTMLIKSSTNSPGSIDLSLNVLLKERLWLGVSVRSGYGWVVLSQLQINDYFKFGYSFDYGMNKIGIAGKASHEIMIGYDLNFKGAKMIMPRYL